MIRLDRWEVMALVAMRDCGVIRAPWSNNTYRQLRHLRLVSYVPVMGTLFVDHRLNDRGSALLKENLR